MRNVTLTFLAFILFLSIINAQNYADCGRALELTSKATYTIAYSSGSGQEANEIKSTVCSEDFKEQESTWLTWTAQTDGELTFELRPLNADDDLDFVVFKTEADHPCASKAAIRCMASGENLYSTISSEECIGRTGLRSSATDQSEKRGCYGLDDNFLEALQVKAGDTYLLAVNNHSSSDGFTIDWGGEALIGPAVAHEWQLTMAPNPAVDRCTFVIEAATAAEAQLEIRDITGNVVVQRNLSLEVGEQVIEQDVSVLPVGAYIVNVISEVQNLSQQLIVQ